MHYRKGNLGLMMLFGLIFSSFSTLGTSADYSEGFTWKRSADYDAGQDVRFEKGKDGTKGNPNRDSHGSAVWRYESVTVQGEPNNGKDPWYTRRGKLMRYTVMWGSGDGGWISKDSIYTAVDQYWLTVSPRDVCPLPVVRWINPVARPFEMEISGTVGISLGWPRAPADVKFVIVHFDASNDDYKSLYAKSISATQTNKNLKVRIGNVRVELGDEIVISVTCPQLYEDNSRVWLTVRDDVNLKLKALLPLESTRDTSKRQTDGS